MNDFLQKINKFICDNSTIALVVIILQFIIIIWLYLKANDIISGFSPKKSEKNKVQKSKGKKKNIKDDEYSDDDEDIKKEPPKKTTIDPTIAQLVKDINQSS